MSVEEYNISLGTYINKTFRTTGTGLVFKELFKYLYIIFNKLIAFLMKSSLFIAMTAFLLPYFSFLLYNIRANVNLLIASSLCIFSIYSLNKLSDMKEDLINNPERVGFIEKYKNIIIFAVIASFIASLLISFLQNPFAIIIMLFPFLMGIFYSIKVSNFRLKDIVGIKNFTVAVSWAVIGAFLPLAVYFSDFILISLIFYFFFIRVFLGSIASDVRDIEGDRASGVRTIPVVFGLNKTKIFLLLLNSTLLPWLAFSYFAGYFHGYFLVLVFFIIYGYWYILHFCREGIKIGKTMDLFVDGEWIPTVILALILA
ncbi:MAG: UbiA family prenyltransferase [Candidatus Methanoperedens sp.]|nr:UbiA family prenyltransferase [Candidatus Methanoperedens sp.]